VSTRERERVSARGPFARPSARAKERTSTHVWAMWGVHSAGPNREKKGESARTAGFVFLFSKM
jgi:hypothetical protein